MFFCAFDFRFIYFFLLFIMLCYLIGYWLSYDIVIDNFHKLRIFRLLCAKYYVVYYMDPSNDLPRKKEQYQSHKTKQQNVWLMTAIMMLPEQYKVNKPGRAGRPSTNIDAGKDACTQIHRNNNNDWTMRWWRTIQTEETGQTDALRANKWLICRWLWIFAPLRFVGSFVCGGKTSVRLNDNCTSSVPPNTDR